MLNELYNEFYTFINIDCNYKWIEKEIKIKLSLIIYIQICKHDVVHYCIFVNLTLNLILFPIIKLKQNYENTYNHHWYYF